jgi:hypothetical protein
VINADGSWTVTMTTGAGHEGAAGQHVVSAVSSDRGRTWSELIDIEPADGPEASWVVPLLVPASGRIYAFYTYNKDNQRTVLTEDGRELTRVDSLGSYAYRFSDDGGRSWSAERYEIPMRLFECDRNNPYGGDVRFFWGVGKPFIHDEAAYVVSCKVGSLGRGFFTQNEGVLFRSDNLLTEPDPNEHRWETLPEGEVGVRTPMGGGRIAGEFNATPMNDGSLYGTFRTVDGYAGRAISRDDGRSWDVDWMRYRPGSRLVKNSRSANFVRRFSNGKYVYWYVFHGGDVLVRHLDEAEMGYAHRNPIWMCGGIEKGGDILWSEPEIVLYDDRIGNRMSYPDFIEDSDGYYFTETQKTTARLHKFDTALLEAMWGQHENRSCTRDGCVLEHRDGGGSVVMPELPAMYNRGAGYVDPGTGITYAGNAAAVERRGGVTIEMRLRFDDLQPWQVVFDSRDDEGRGLFVQLNDRGQLILTVGARAYDTPGARFGNGVVFSSHGTDHGALEVGAYHHIVFILDGGPKVISAVVDGILCDGGDLRQFGWGRFHPSTKEANGAAEAQVAPSLNGELLLVRLYERYLLTSEAVGNYRSGE